MVNAGTPVVQLLSTGQKEIEASLPQELYLQRSRFGKITASIHGRTYSLRLRNIVPVADNNQLFRAVFLIANADANASEGMNANVAIHLNDGTEQQGYVLPPHAILEKDGQTYVWVVGKDNRVHRHAVTTSGMDADGNVIISSGISRHRSSLSIPAHQPIR